MKNPHKLAAHLRRLATRLQRLSGTLAVTDPKLNVRARRELQATARSLRRQADGIKPPSKSRRRQP